MYLAGLSNAPTASLGILLVLCISLPLVYWRLKMAKRRRRQAFVDQFNPYDLRMNQFNTTTVFHVVGRVKGRLRIQVVWSESNPVRDGKEYMVNEAEIAPFDQMDFLSRW